MDEQRHPKIAVHYSGNFIPNPLVYFGPRIATLSDRDINTMTFEGFKNSVEALIDRRVWRMYFSPPGVSLSQGLHALQNDCDYSEFVEVTNERKLMNVYIDTDNEPLFEWIANEEGEDLDDDDSDDETYLPDREECEHEEDDEVIPTQTHYADSFLGKLVPPKKVTEGEEDEERLQPAQYPRHDENQPWDAMEPELGMRFTDPEEVKVCLRNYEKNCREKMLVRCCRDKDPPCTFRLWASWMKEEATFQIKSLIKEHRCSRSFKLGSIVNYKWIGKALLKDILESPKVSLRQMKAKVSEKYNLNVSVGQCKNAKRYDLTEIEGSLKEHYSKLWDYASEIRRSNPGSHVEVFVQPQNDSSVVFERFYVSFKGVVQGWLDGCRKVVGVDGCFLKGICKGQLLSCVGRDANNHLYPIAWAVVNVESKQSWEWFLGNLMEDIHEGGTGRGLTLLSDGHKGLAEAVKVVCPDVEHRLCARHILANFNLKFKGECYIKHFWKVAKATTETKFEEAMETIKAYDVRAYQYLIDRNPMHWSRAFFQVGQECDAVENGICESFNSAIDEARCKPIITMLEDIRVWTMQRLYLFKLAGRRYVHATCLSIKRKVETLKMYQRFWNPYVSGYKRFEVIQGTERYDVNLETRECSCRSWQLRAYPCVHAMSAIAHMNLNSDDYIGECYSKASFLVSYEHKIQPLADNSMWPRNPDLNAILPPLKRRMPGRSCVKRKRAVNENEISGKAPSRHTVRRTAIPLRCTLCKEIGHNKATCVMRPSKPPTGKKTARKRVPPHASFPGQSSSSATFPGQSGTSQADETPMDPSELFDEGVGPSDDETPMDFSDLAQLFDEGGTGVEVNEVVVEDMALAVNEVVEDMALAVNEIVQDEVVEDLALNEVVEEQGGLVVRGGRHRVSERVIKNKLKKVVVTEDGRGLAADAPVVLED